MNTTKCHNKFTILQLKINVTVINYFTTFLQTIDVINFISFNMGPLLTSHLCLSIVI